MGERLKVTRRPLSPGLLLGFVAPLTVVTNRGAPAENLD